MSIDILQFRRFSNNSNTISVAFPVLAYECELSSPYENELDAYEEAALKYISIGLAINGIAKALNINESLSAQIVSKLEMEKFVSKISGVGFKLTETGKKYLIGIKEERPSDNSVFGYMFVSALRKDVLPFFYEGDIGKIDRTDGRMVDCKLTEKDENTTFTSTSTPKLWRLSRAYQSSLYIGGLDKQVEDDEITFVQAQDIYANIDSFDEAEYREIDDVIDNDTNVKETQASSDHGTFVRLLKRKPEALYLKMQIIVSSDLPGGFIVESPLDRGGIDNEFFLRQIKWMIDKGDILYNGSSFKELINNEILKLCGSAKTEKEDVAIFMLKSLPLLSVQKDRYSRVYSDVSDIYELMRKNMTSLARESVVMGLNKRLLEALFNKLLRSKTQNELKIIRDKAISDFNSFEDAAVLNITTFAKVNRECLPSNSMIRGAVNRLAASNGQNATLGNSITQKLINIMVAFYYLPSPQIEKFLKLDDLADCIDKVMRLNAIRNKASHDGASGNMTAEDYSYYISNVFLVANRLLKSLEGNNG